MKTKREFEDLLSVNGYPKRLIRKLSEHFPIDHDEEAEEVAEAVSALKDLTERIKKSIASELL